MLTIPPGNNILGDNVDVGNDENDENDDLIDERQKLLLWHDELFEKYVSVMRKEIKEEMKMEIQKLATSKSSSSYSSSSSSSSSSATDTGDLTIDGVGGEIGEGYDDDSDPPISRRRNSSSSSSSSRSRSRHRSHRRMIMMSMMRLWHPTSNDINCSSIDAINRRNSNKDDDGNKESATATTASTKTSNSRHRHQHELPEDIYAFIICSPVGSLPWFLSLAVVLMQFVVFSFFLVNITDVGTGEDNPLRIPANVEISVKVVQVCAILITTFLQDDLRTAMELGIVYWTDRNNFQLLLPPKKQENKNSSNNNHVNNVLGGGGGGAAAAAAATPGETEINSSNNDHHRNCFCSKWVHSVILRGSQGMLSLWVYFILIVQSDNVFDLLINFTAVLFISELDEVAFRLACGGYFGNRVDKATQFVKETRYTYGPVASTEEEAEELRKTTHYAILCIVLVGMYTSFGIKAYKQENMEYYTCGKEGVYAEFDDGTDPILGTYTGFFNLSGTTGSGGYPVYRNADGAGLGFCSDESFWALFRNEDDDPCMFLAKSSKTKSFDIMEIDSSTWFDRNGFPLERAQFSCTNRDRCAEKASRGDFCTDLLVAQDVRFTFDISNTFVALEEGKVQVHDHPVYLGRRTNNNVDDSHSEDEISADLLVFIGNRCVLIDRNKIESSPQLNNVTDLSALVTALERKELRGSQLPRGAVRFISDAVDISSETCSPIGLSWYQPIQNSGFSNGNGKVGFPSADLTRSSEASLTCYVCNNESNPCLFGGVCQANGCVCNYRTTGRLCEVSPLGDGICDEHFNTPQYGYDGGDCCGATCDESPSCGLETLDSAFGTILTTGRGNGFPSCVDHEMIELTIVAEPYGADINGLWSARIQLDCDGRNHLFLPLGNVYMQGRNETIMVRIGAECQLHVTSQEYRGDTRLRVIDPEGEVLAEVIPVVADRMTEDFLVIRSCLRGELVKAGLPSLNPAEFDALRWINNDKVEGFQCGDPLFKQRHALAVLSYSTGNVLQHNQGWLLSGPHCNKWAGVSCNRNNSVVRLDIGELDLEGTLPTELGFFSDLYELLSGGNSRLSGNIPSEISTTNLEFLDLGDNLLNGTIPTELGLLTNLEFLDLGDNLLNGPIPTELGLLTNLEFLIINSNALTGPIPTQLGLLVNLKKLAINDNNLKGTIPSEIDLLTKLTTFCW